MEMILIEKNELEQAVEKAISRGIEIAQRHLQNDRLLTLKELSAWLGVTEQTINNWMRDQVKYSHNPFPVEYAGDLPRFDKKEVRAWMKANKKVKDLKN